ncbi:MAG: hypothetical protein QXR19_15040, partial [Candidatus Jordarchaeaceae archaeon]
GSFIYYNILWGSGLVITITPTIITYSAIGFTVLSVSLDSLKVVPIFFGYDPLLVAIVNPVLYWVLFATICSSTLAGGALIAFYAPVDFLIRVKDYEYYKDAKKGLKLVIVKGSWKSKIIILYTTLSFTLFYLVVLLTVMGWFQIIHITIIQRSLLLICTTIPLFVLFLLHSRFTQTIQKEIYTLK